MTLNGHFALYSVLRRYVWSSEAWLSQLDYSLKLVVNVVEKRKEQLWYRAVFLRQHGFLILYSERCRPRDVGANASQCHYVLYLSYEF